MADTTNPHLALTLAMADVIDDIISRHMASDDKNGGAHVAFYSAHRIAKATLSNMETVHPSPASVGEGVAERLGKSISCIRARHSLYPSESVRERYIDLLCDDAEAFLSASADSGEVERLKASNAANADHARLANQNLKDMQRTFDLRWKADQRAIKRWQSAHPGNDLVWPDHADLCIWLLDELDRLRTPTDADVEAGAKAAKAVMGMYYSDEFCRTIARSVLNRPADFNPEQRKDGEANTGNQSKDDPKCDLPRPDIAKPVGNASPAEPTGSADAEGCK